MEGLVGGNGAGEEMPRPRMWYEPGGQLEIPLRLLEEINRRREDYHNPEYWRRVRREQREREAMWRQEEVNPVVGEEVVLAENELDLEEQEGEGNDVGEEEAIVQLEQEAGERGIDASNEVAGGDDENGGDGFENALEEEEILERVEVTDKVAGGDAGTEEVEGGAVISDKEELNGLVEGEGGAVKHGSFEGGGEETGQDKEEANTPSTPQVTEDEKVEAEDNNHVELPTPPKRNKRRSFIIPAHVTVLPGIPPKYRCNVCQKDFKTKANIIKYHRFCGQPNTSNPFQCSICDKGFISKGHYDYHLLQHKSLPSFKCIFCEKRFFHQGNLNRHLRVHIRERPYMCQECPGCFSTSQDLNDHVDAVHKSKGSQAFPCSQCPMRFDTKKYLNKHVSSVHGNRKFECVECGKVFGRKFNLNKHARSVHLKQRPHSCKSCTRSFFNKNDLRRHAMTHTDERRFKCRICGKGSSRKGNLEVHVRNVHGVAKENLADKVVIEAVTSNGRGDGEKEMSMSN